MKQRFAWDYSSAPVPRNYLAAALRGRSRGRTWPKNPLIGYHFFSDWCKDPYRLLRWANDQGIDLSDEEAILRRLAAEEDGIEPSETP